MPDDPINPQPAPTGAAPKPDSAPASRGRLGRWFGFQVDNKPWWIVVLVAGLGAVGAGIVGEVPSVVSWVSSFFSTTKIFILVTDENSGGPLDDVVVYFQNMETLERVHLLGSEQNDTVKTRGGGNAYVKMHVSDDAGYKIIFKYTASGRTHVHGDVIEIAANKSYAFKVDPNKWPVEGSNPVQTPVPVNQVSLPADAPGWLNLAKGEIGVQETVGGVDNPRITEYFATTKLGPQPASLPWNSAFVNWVLTKSGISGTNSGQARSWLGWGKSTELRTGCIAVFWRVSPESGLGHVGFLVGQEGDSLKILGGNQNDSVNVISMNKNYLLGCRWPA